MIPEGLMKAIFFIQDYHFNKNINYEKITENVNCPFYLLTYHATQDELNKYIKTRYTKSIFKQCFSMEKIDETIIKAFVEKEAVKYNNEVAIVTNAESAVAICGKLRQYLKLHDDDMVRYVDKIVMKRSLNNKIPVPKYLNFDRKTYQNNPRQYFEYIKQTLNMPFFVKPTNQYSSRGTKMIYQFDEFQSWYKTSTEDSIEIDEVVNGTLYHCDSFIKNEKILYTQICEYLYPCYDFILGKPLGGFTLPQETELYKELNEFNAKVLDTMRPPSGGLTHLEVFKSSNGELIFLEVAARPAGAKIPEMYKKNLNIMIREAHILLQVDANYMPNISPNGFSAYISYPTKLGQVTNLNQPMIKSEHQLIWNIQPGDILKAPDKISDVAGSIILWNNDFNQLTKDIDYLKTFNAFHVNGNNI